MESDSPITDIRIGHVSHEWAEAQKIRSFYFPSLDSTNVKAKSEAFADDTLAEHLIVYFAESQTAGKGRGANTWSNAPLGSQPLSTWSFMLHEHVQPVLSPLLGLALYRAAMNTWPFVNFNLKAPNDLYIDDRKVAGLLIETVTQGEDIRLLVGIGINVIAAPKDMDTATSIVAELPRTAPLLAQDWITFLERFVFEISIAIQMSLEPMDTTVQASLLHALNKHPLLMEKYLAIDENGTITTPTKKINWFEL